TLIFHMTISVPNWVADLGEMVTFMLTYVGLALYITGGSPPLEYCGTSRQRHRRLETLGTFSALAFLRWWPASCVNGVGGTGRPERRRRRRQAGPGCYFCDFSGHSYDDRR